MFWLGVVLFIIAWAVALLVWASCALAREGDEALEELEESLRRLQQAAASVARTSGRSAELMRQRAANSSLAREHGGRSHATAASVSGVVYYPLQQRDFAHFLDYDAALQRLPDCRSSGTTDADRRTALELLQAADQDRRDCWPCLAQGGLLGRDGPAEKRPRGLDPRQCVQSGHGSDLRAFRRR
jgi:hypothetical protein